MKQLCVLKKPLRATFKLQTNIRRRFTENVGICFFVKIGIFHQTGPIVNSFEEV